MKSSRDLQYNRVHGVNRIDWTHQNLGGKTGLNFLYAWRLLHSQIPLELGVACGYQQGLPAEGRSPQPQVSRVRGTIHSEALIRKSLNEPSGRVMDNNQSKCHKTY